jgi:hypothetical protein
MRVELECTWTSIDRMPLPVADIASLDRNALGAFTLHKRW